MSIPVLFINFNRPQFTTRSLEQIKKYAPKQLYIACDGPRSHVQGDAANVQNVRDILREISWPCEVRRRYFFQNQGCKKSVQGALDWFFHHEEMGVILEDDCLASLSFFKYAEHLLKKYRNDKRVAAISGNSVGFQSAFKNKYSYRFTQYMNMWGWATWRRTHKIIDPEMKLFKMSTDPSRVVKNLFQFYNSKLDNKWIDYWNHQFSKTSRGEIDTWDYQWIFSILAKEMVCISPETNMVENIGWGPGATHTHEENALMKSNIRREMRFPIAHPNVKQIRVDQEYEEHVKEAWCDLTKFYDLFLRNTSSV